MKSECNNETNDDVIISFNLQNVIRCPKTGGNFFYKRKLNVYNLTPHVKVCKRINKYCIVWPELTSGSSGNNLASGLKF